MRLFNFFPSPLTISVIIFISIFLLSHNFRESACAEDIPHSNCTSLFECGKLRGIGYPFWGEGRPFNCGHPKFGLRCEGGKPTIEIMSQKYLVLDIHHETRLLKIVKPQYFFNGNIICPESNTTMDSDFFRYTSNNQNATLFYDCDPESQDPQRPPIFDLFCMKDEKPGHASFVKDINLANQLASRCRVSVVVPVLVTAVQGLMNHSLLTNEVLRQGFEVEWIIDKTQCRACIVSGGNCRYNWTSQKPFCACGESGGQAYPINCTNPPASPPTAPSPTASNSAESKPESTRRKVAIAIAIAGGGILFACFLIICYCLRKRSDGDAKIEAFVKNYGSLAPKRYSYSDVKKMTDSFRNKLGQGGFGSVYRGMLPDGRLVAVKLLDTSKETGEGFINEVASISRTSHVNIVSLWGFCYESGKRALIYEFMCNGSLEKFIYGEDPLRFWRHLAWEKLYQIAIGIARGLEYLHCRCNTQILHFDVKPHNILLDDDFCPKISDFGLAKLCHREDGVVSMRDARGTMGYVAPEVFNRNYGEVSSKSDVYSYGMMSLEMVGGRKNINAAVSHTSKIYFPHWVYKRLELAEDLGLQGIVNKEENEIARKMIVVGLWCIQINPSHRPSMSKVIEMLEGSIEALQIPPKPFLSSPSRSPADSSISAPMDI